MRYTIKKGKYSSGVHFGLHTGRVSQTYKVRFDSSCLYNHLEEEVEYNKLQGWSYSPLLKDLVRLKFNSLQLGWRPTIDNKKIEVCLILHQDGVKSITQFAVVEIGKEYTLGIFYKVDKDEEIDTIEYHPRVIATCTQREEPWFIATKTIKLDKPFVVRASYNLFPRFGGSTPAPQNMVLYSKET